MSADPAAGPGALRLAEIISALSYALDLSEGQAQGHAVRSCLVGMRLAREVGLAPAEESALFYALLLKDAGCSSTAARLSALFGADDRRLKRAHRTTDWTRPLPSFTYAVRHVLPDGSPVARAVRLIALGRDASGAVREMVRMRCERGAEIATAIGLAPLAAETIRHQDEHWDGDGMPAGLRGTAIPLLARIACLAQTVEVYSSTYDVDAAYAIAAERSGTWFDPALVDALRGFRRDFAFWETLRHRDPRTRLHRLEPPDRILTADEAMLDRVAAAFARVVDAKSPYTEGHSERVAELAVGIGTAIGLDAGEVGTLRRAALLHDLGTLGVSNLILDKPDPLTEEEMAAVRHHPACTWEILSRFEALRPIAETSAAHHERLDGRGYPRGLAGNRLPPAARVLAVAEVIAALGEDRPHRPGLPPDEAMRVARGMAGAALCPPCVEVAAALLDPAGRGPVTPPAPCPFDFVPPERQAPAARRTA